MSSMNCKTNIQYEIDKILGKGGLELNFLLLKFMNFGKVTQWLFCAWSIIFVQFIFK